MNVYWVPNNTQVKSGPNSPNVSMLFNVGQNVSIFVKRDQVGSKWVLLSQSGWKQSKTIKNMVKIIENCTVGQHFKRRKLNLVKIDQNKEIQRKYKKTINRNFRGNNKNVQVKCKGYHHHYHPHHHHHHNQHHCHRSSLEQSLWLGLP